RATPSAATRASSKNQPLSDLVQSTARMRPQSRTYLALFVAWSKTQIEAAGMARNVMWGILAERFFWRFCSLADGGFVRDLRRR
ncbi:MAG: hypothetical protein PPHEINF_5686, partial [uncultured Paraburkholderia sp.]